jgi:hypothetical protein
MPTRDGTIAAYVETTGATLRDLEYYMLLASLRLAITLIPAADSLIAREIITAESRFAHDSVPTQMIARHLGISEPELSPDYRRLSRMRKRQATS